MDKENVITNWNEYTKVSVKRPVHLLNDLVWIFQKVSEISEKMIILFHFWSLLGFPTGRDSATFQDSGTAKTFLSRDKGTTGQKFLYCPGTKGQRDKLKILPRDGTGRDSQNLGRDGPGQPKSGTGRGTKRDRAEKDVLKQYKDVLKQKRMF